MQELKPCPFCGRKAKMHKRLNSPCYAVVCEDTKCPGHNLYVLFWNEKEAVEAWNRRTDRKTGKWILKRKLVPLAIDTMPLDYENYDEATHSEWKEYYYCSECNYESGEFTGGKFCANCGSYNGTETEE